jgi:hypothetical protein
MFQRSDAKKPEEVLCLLVKADWRRDRQFEIWQHSGSLREVDPRYRTNLCKQVFEISPYKSAWRLESHDLSSGNDRRRNRRFLVTDRVTESTSAVTVRPMVVTY